MAEHVIVHMTRVLIETGFHAYILGYPDLATQPFEEIQVISPIFLASLGIANPISLVGSIGATLLPD